MIGTETLLIIGVLLIGFYMSWNIGANDVANAMGTSVGSKALTLKKAVLVAAVLEFSGAFLLGSNVSETLQSGLVDPAYFLHDPTRLVFGMTAALLSTSIWLQIASFFGWPVSTTHAIVGSIVGFGVIIGGIDAIHWIGVLSVASSWVLSPLISGLISFLTFSFLQRKILYAYNPTYAAKRFAPYFVFIAIASFTFATGYDGIAHLNLSLTPTIVVMIALVIATIAAMITHFVLVRARLSNLAPSTGSIRGTSQIISLNKAIKHLKKVKLTSSGEVRKTISETIKTLTSSIDRIKEKIETKPKQVSEYKAVEHIFSYLQIITACFVAFAHGANDVANAIGPVASVIHMIQNPHHIAEVTSIPIWLLAIGGGGIIVGLATWGWRVIETIGRKITELTPSRGFCAEFGAATTILVASKIGLPISTTHCIVGSVLGIGLAKGISALNLRMIRDIVLSWIVTIPSSALVCIVFYYIIEFFLGSISLT